MNKDQQIEIVNNYKDYKEVEDIMFPFGSINQMGGQFYSEIQYESIELNKPVDESLFIKPTK